MMGWLIGISIVLQVICAVVSCSLSVTARNGSWRFWAALTTAFLGLILHRSVWLFDDVMGFNHEIVGWASVFISLAFLAAMAEAAIFHQLQRRQITALSDNIGELERRLEERERGRTGA